MSLTALAALELQKARQNAMEDVEPLKLELLTMTVSCPTKLSAHVQPSNFYWFLCFHFTAMIIGFTSRTQIVPENIRDGISNFPLSIDVATLRTAEREHPMMFRLQISSSTAIVEPIGAVVNPFYDATFGTRDSVYGPIIEEYDLLAGMDTITSLVTFIRNDRRPEEKTICFTIRIFPVDVPGRHELFTCNEDDSGESSYFCEHTICIIDDDGKVAK